MKRLTFFTMLAGLLLAGVGCISFSAGDQLGSGSDGGIFRSANRGDDWEQRAAIPSIDGSQRTIGAVDVVSIMQDPSDPNALYIGTATQGMFYSYDAGMSWFRPAALSAGRVEAIAIDPRDKCTVYATFANRIMKTQDCSRTWQAAYLDARTDRRMTAVMVDHFNPSVVWIATDSGDIIRSMDSGVSWTSMYNVRNPVTRIAMSAEDSRRLVVGTKSAGVWRSMDGGTEWTDLTEKYREYRESRDFYDLAVGKSSPNLIIIATKYGLIRSQDFGDTWEAIELLTPSGSTIIYSVAIDPKDGNTLYYGTATTFYRSPNGGVNWVPKRLPSTRSATVMKVDQNDSNVLYMGMTAFK